MKYPTQEGLLHVTPVCHFALLKLCESEQAGSNSHPHSNIEVTKEGLLHVKCGSSRCQKMILLLQRCSQRMMPCLRFHPRQEIEMNRKIALLLQLV